MYSHGATNHRYGKPFESLLNKRSGSMTSVKFNASTMETQSTSGDYRGLTFRSSAATRMLRPDDMRLGFFSCDMADDRQFIQ